MEIGTENDQEFWLEKVDWGVVSGTHQTYTGSNQVGESIGATVIGTRDLSITGWAIEDNTPLQTRCNLLNSFFSPSEDYLLVYKDYQISFRPDTSIKYGGDYTKNNKVMRNFLIQATCPYPLFEKTADTVVLFESSQKRFRFPTNFGLTSPVIFATTEVLYNTTLFNPGGFPTGVKIIISFIGDVTNPKIKDLKTQEFIGVNGTFHSGERLELITKVGGKSITLFHQNETPENLIKDRDVDTTWLQLRAGKNLWALECDDPNERGNMKVSISFTPLYLEVE